VKGSAVDKGEKGILLKEISSKIESDQAMMQEIGKIKDLQLQNLKKIVEKHSSLSKLYNEIKTWPKLKMTQ
jgi:hypothetical protein